MNKERLKKHAELLEHAIKNNLHRSKDVEFLASHPILMQAIIDAKAELINTPRNLGGLSRWEMESNLGDVHEVSLRLAQFSLLLEGWDLPSETE